MAKQSFPAPIHTGRRRDWASREYHSRKFQRDTTKNLTMFACFTNLCPTHCKVYQVALCH